MTRQKGTVLQVFDRLSVGVQHSLYSLDDFIAMGQEELEKFDMCLKRHLARTRSGWPLFRSEERMKSQASKQFANPEVDGNIASGVPAMRNRPASKTLPQLLFSGTT